MACDHNYEWEYRACKRCDGDNYYYYTDYKREPNEYGKYPRVKVEPCDASDCSRGRVRTGNLKCSKCGRYK
jgi:hypothetical protein